MFSSNAAGGRWKKSLARFFLPFGPHVLPLTPLHQAQSFDILLFHSKDRIVAQLIRSEFPANPRRRLAACRLFLLEAAQSSIRKGIQLIPFARFASVFKLYKEKYSRICYRKLIIPGGATPKQLHELSEFARKVMDTMTSLSGTVTGRLLMGVLMKSGARPIVRNIFSICFFHVHRGPLGAENILLFR
eukprot:1374423-Amorphochlora_amoeboformis.AAC.1